MEAKNRRVKDIEDLANRSVCSLAPHTRDEREAIHFGRLCQTEEDLHSLLRPSSQTPSCSEGFGGIELDEDITVLDNAELAVTRDTDRLYCPVPQSDI